MDNFGVNPNHDEDSNGEQQSKKPKVKASTIVNTILTVITLGGFAIIVVGILFQKVGFIITGFIIFFVCTILMTIVGRILKAKEAGEVSSQVQQMIHQQSVRPVIDKPGDDQKGGLVCPKCGHQNDVEAKFCSNCGEPLQKICPKCGASNDCNATFCKHCGAKIG